MTHAPWTRRRFVLDGSLWVAAAALVGCKPEGVAGSGANAASPPPPRAPDPRGVEPSTPYGTVAPPPEAHAPSAPPAPSGGTASCVLTPDNIEGPYYRVGAPLRSDLTDASTTGTPLIILGRVTDPGCKAISGATLDVWQADKDGRYDNDGHAGDKLVLRGKLVTHDDGTFEFRTIVPGRYLNGRQYRPAHVHVKVSATGFLPLTTQLYFDGDPYNKVDPFIKSPLVMSLADEGKAKVGRFDFALRRG